jgi:ribosomal protein S18 acetylase RimI-like enzyme
MTVQPFPAGNRLSIPTSGGRLRRIPGYSARGPGVRGTRRPAEEDCRLLQPERRERLPHYPVPAAILGRLAVDREQQGRGLGEILLLDAIQRVVRASATLALCGIVVDAKNDRAVAFYERYDFRALASEQRRLFLPLETFEKLGL